MDTKVTQSAFVTAVVVGGGPAGLMAAETLATQGLKVSLYEAMPTVGRKFLMAGRGGLNITHSEPFEQFCKRYAEAQPNLQTALNEFTPIDLVNWCHELGIETFIGSSGRVFPKEMKAAPLLRKWIQRLKHQGVEFHTRHRWVGWDETKHVLNFETPNGTQHISAKIVILATGGGSWRKLGSDGQWTELLKDKQVQIAPFKPTNCGFECEWSSILQGRHSGAPLKGVTLTFEDNKGSRWQRKGELLIAKYGLEGSLIYAASSLLREKILTDGIADLFLDLMPDRPFEDLLKDMSKPHGSRSINNHLKRLGLKPVFIDLLRDRLSADAMRDPQKVTVCLKHYPIQLTTPRPIDEAISTAGGVKLSEMNNDFMLSSHPGFFCAGEMLDWEAPTGGYLLTACFATGQHAGRAALNWIRTQEPSI